MNQPLNIIYFVVHDIGRHISPYNAKIDTPHLAEFAAEGANLKNVFCTSPPCSPSRSSVMTGRYAHCNGLMGLVNMGWSMPRSEKTLVNDFNESGYETVHVGFQHERAFEEDNHYQKCYNEKDGDIDDRLIENVVDRGIAYLESRCQDDKPFYMNLATQESHASLWAPDAFYGKQLQRAKHVYGVDAPEDVWIPPQLPDNAKTREMLGLFNPCIRYMDKEFGRFVKAVDRLGFRENTLFIFTTDHGIHGSRAKGTLYDHGTEISTLVRLPGVIEPNSEHSELITNLDFCPTILDAAGIPIPDRVQGRSFWNLMTGDLYEKNTHIFTERNYHCLFDPMRAVRTEDYLYIRNFDPNAKKYLTAPEIENAEDSIMRDSWPNEMLYDTPSKEIRNWPSRPATELYSVLDDPNQFTDIASDDSHKQIVSELDDMIQCWMTETNDPLLNGPIEDKLFGWPERQTTVID